MEKASDGSFRSCHPKYRKTTEDAGRRQDAKRIPASALCLPSSPLSLIMKKVRQLTQPGMLFVSLREHDSIRSDRPLDTEIDIIPKHASIMAGAVIGGYFVKNLGFVFEGAKTMEEAGDRKSVV